MVAIEDDGMWYFVQVGEKMTADVFKAVYPSFADVSFVPNNIVQIGQ